MTSQRHGAGRRDTSSWKRPRTWALLAAALLPIVGLTLRLPHGGPGGGASTLPSWCLACGSRGAADFLLNIALFVPLGAALRAAGVRPLITGLIGLALSGGIETAQLWMPGRYTSLGDLLANGLGAAIGAVLLGTGTFSLRAPPSARRQIVLTALVATVWIGTALAFRPSLPERDYYGQWTAQLGYYGNYGGRVLSATIGEQPAPSRRLGSSAAARLGLLAGDTVAVTVVAGPPPPRLAPIFSIYDDQQEEVLLMGAEGNDLVLRVRRRAADLRFEAPERRWKGALDGVSADDTVRLAAWRPSVHRRAGGSTLCLRVQEKERCAAPGVGSGWVLLLGPDVVPPRAAAAMDSLWLVALVGLALGWAPGRRAAGAGLAVLVVVAGLTVAL